MPAGGQYGPQRRGGGGGNDALRPLRNSGAVNNDYEGFSSGGNEALETKEASLTSLASHIDLERRAVTPNSNPKSLSIIHPTHPKRFGNLADYGQLLFGSDGPGESQYECKRRQGAENDRGCARTVG